MSLDRRVLIDRLMLNEGKGPMRGGHHLPYLDCCGQYWRLCQCLQKGALTIGYGRNLDAEGISAREGSDLLEHNVDEAITDVSMTYQWFVLLDPVRQRAIVELRFNVGFGGLRTFRKLIAAMARGDYAGAASELRDSVWFTQVQAARSTRLLHMLATGSDL